MFLIITLYFLPFTFTFNIDTNNPIVYFDPTKTSSKSSYFGYSLALYPENNQSWIFIGAPRAENSGLKFANPGSFFKCGLKAPCEEVDVSDSPIASHQGFNKNFYKKLLNNSWIGGSMDINYEYNRVVTCAHRWIHHTSSRKDYYMHGSCYWFHANDSRKVYTLVPMSGGRDTHQGKVYLYGQGQAGASVHMPPKKPELLIGAPGVYNWKGTAILYKDDLKEYFSNLHIADTINTYETTAFDLFGYSSTSGYFYKDRTLFYVSGAPKASYYHGKVLIYTFGSAKDSKSLVKQQLEGNQFGEYFGAAVTAGDVNNDGYDDLIVGAPFYSSAEMKYNEGKVYIFMGNQYQLSPGQTVIGKSSNGQFGTCVQYLGDINGDGYGDLAISAPYEMERTGAVYIYRGTSRGIDTNHPQRIAGNDILPEIRGFGIGISRAADIDHSGFSDVAIGAYLSGHVVVLRAYPAVAIRHNITKYTSNLDVEKRSFEIGTCFWFTLSQASAQVSIRRSIIVDEVLGRGQLKDAQPVETLTLSPNVTVCKNYIITYEPLLLNQSLTVSLSHEMILAKAQKEAILVSKTATTGTDLFCKNCPVYDNVRSSPPISIEFPFALNCGSDKICKSKLQFDPQFTNLDKDNVFVVGSNDTLTLTTSVENFGENAYSTKIFFRLPKTVGFQSTPSNCVEKRSSVLTCDVDNPLKTNQKHTVTIHLDMTTVNWGIPDDSLNFTVTIKTSSFNDLNLPTTKILNVKLQRDANVTLTGKSNEEFYSYNKEETSNLAQTYFVSTDGVSVLNEVTVELALPRSIKTSKNTEVEIVLLRPVRARSDYGESLCIGSDFRYVNEMKGNDLGDTEDTVVGDSRMKTRKRRTVQTNQTLIYNIPSNRTFYINCSKPEVVCSKIVCAIGQVRPGQVVKIEINLVLNISVVKSFLNKNDVIFFATSGQVMKNNGTVEVTSLLIGDNVKEVISLWIIVISIVVGVLLLLLVILGLIKAGFFKRKTKEELEQLKKEMEFMEEPPQL